ncbi:MAG: coenzyme F420-0:L-glutamate ligase [Patescibacteria group bacterium]|mgnify:CR=1 FL=1
MNVHPVKTRVFEEGEDLAAFIAWHVPELKDGSILAVTSKIVALAEGRTADAKDKEKIIRAESDWAIETKQVWLTEKDGMLLANAGVDASNADGKLILLPKDSFKVAIALRRELQKHFKLKKLGILITDSRVMPLRTGVVGVALGHSGFRGLRDYRGKKDIFGRALKFTQTNIADSLATSATLAMGEGGERQPLCIIEGAPVEFCEKINRKELKITLKDDMFYPLFKTVLRRRRK